MLCAAWETPPVFVLGLKPLACYWTASPCTERHFEFCSEADLFGVFWKVIRGGQRGKTQTHPHHNPEPRTWWVPRMLCSIALLISWFSVTWQPLRVPISLSGEDNDLVCCQEMAVTDKLVNIIVCMIIIWTPSSYGLISALWLKVFRFPSPKKVSVPVWSLAHWITPVRQNYTNQFDELGIVHLLINLQSFRCLSKDFYTLKMQTWTDVLSPLPATSVPSAGGSLGTQAWLEHVCLLMKEG